MAGRSSGNRQSSRGQSQQRHSRNYPRSARINEVLREIVAEELERIDDDRLGLLTITGVTVDSDLRHATVWLSALMHEGGVDSMLAAVNEHRAPLQTSIARQLRMKRTPLLQFAADPAITNGQRIEDVIRALPPRREHPEDETEGETHDEIEAETHDEIAGGSLP
jgi:ribosome-binding factor A